MSDENTRKSTVTATDRYGYWIVSAEGLAGTWHAASRSLDIALALAVHASMIGESHAGTWEPSDDVTIAPYALSWGSVQDVRQDFARMERIWTAAIRGTLLTAQDYADDILTDADWDALDTGAVIFPSRLGQGLAVILSADSTARIIRLGVEYTDADGQTYMVDPTDTVL